jgi:hypothetical protein
MRNILMALIFFFIYGQIFSQEIKVFSLEKVVANYINDFRETKQNMEIEIFYYFEFEFDASSFLNTDNFHVLNGITSKGVRKKESYLVIFSIVNDCDGLLVYPKRYKIYKKSSKKVSLSRQEDSLYYKVVRKDCI